jgi:predicted permease
VTTALLDVLLPVFVVLAAGAVLGRTLRLEVAPLNRLGLYGAVPALVFTSLATTELGAADLSVLLSGQLLFLLTMAFAATLCSRGLAGPKRRGFVATSVFGNSGNMMLPLALFAFGEAGLERALVLFVLSSVVLFSCGPLVLTSSRGLRELPLSRHVTSFRNSVRDEYPRCSD